MAPCREVAAAEVMEAPTRDGPVRLEVALRPHGGGVERGVAAGRGAGIPPEDRAEIVAMIGEWIHHED
jgi:hypothetical protein